MRRPNLIALSDSANFYVSAERIFDPTLTGVPVIVLSNNDGCAIARSDEAKALGIKMGAPLHLIRDKVERHGIRVFSSNYTLYGDISRRVVEVYRDFSPAVEIYSIDECFLDFSGIRGLEAHARSLIAAVQQRIGIPVRVGIGPTKTLAKVANELAKRNPIFDKVMDISDQSIAEHMLSKMAVKDVWGIGRRTQAKLAQIGIHTAADLRDMPSRLARQIGTVTLERTVLELQGEACIDFEEVEPQRQGMAVTRSAGTPMRDLETLCEALAAHATRVGEKLRYHGLVAGQLTVMFHTNPHRQDRPQFSTSRTAELAPMTNSTLELVAMANRCAKAAWPRDHADKGYAFTKAGIIVGDLLRAEDQPRTLFDAPNPASSALMRALDSVNARFGKKTLVLAAEGIRNSGTAQASHRSPKWTTRITDLPIVR
ncbi:Y-family DNA polymerase [Thioclava litoralis]|uniref:DNA-directed DNA polymerase n=1 Tax=Thioclava litoralis TaxID=3076557 RepID=A0ABZ1DXI2_9RHOB|nr:Y-family DNA polymerase [Thioclava sp. FTW29]